MKNKLFIFGFFLLLFQFSSASHAGQKVKSVSKYWIKDYRQNKVLNASGWHYCYSTRGGTCGRRSLSTGKDKCTSWTVSVGVDYSIQQKELPNKPNTGKFKIITKGQRSWTICNTRSETITCSPNKGYRGRAAIFAEARYGNMRFRGTKTVQVTGKRNASDARKSCKKGFKPTRVWKYCAKFGCHWRATCTPTDHNVKGYWPNSRYSRCEYRRT